MKVADGQQVLLGVRPETFELANGAASLPARVEVIEPTGADTLLMCRTGGQEAIVVLRERTEVAPGDRISLQPDLAKLHVFDAGSGINLTA
jgi:multiple sugar transport system ATP-binding protein